MTLSFSQLLWQTSEFQNEQEQITRLCNSLQISSAFAKILINRNLSEVGDVEQFLNPSSVQCHDPFLMRDMKKAVERIYSALMRREKVSIYGDYDADGTAGTVILYKYFKRIGMRVHYFIPERLKDGYGMSEETLKTLKRKNVDLIITVDNGITAISEALILKKLGMELIITDHHQVISETPVACAILNPQQPQCSYPFKGLCGTGVAYKLLIAFDHFLTEQNYWELSGYIRPDLNRDLDLVAFATVADRVPLVDENRFFVKAGLKIINSAPRPGLQKLMKECNIRRRVTPNVISFKLAPKINAVGRLSDPNTGVNLLLAHSLSEARPFASRLIQVNTERQQIERKVFNAALALAKAQKDQSLIILIDDYWHSGVIGSVAAKIAGRFRKPTVILTLFHEKQAMGSIRSVGDFDVCNALRNCEELLDKFGGHKAAAGLSLDAVNVKDFCHQFRTKFESGQLDAPRSGNDALTIDAWINPMTLKEGLVEELISMAPFGTQNPEPILAMENTKIKNLMVIGNQHLKFDVNTSELDMEVFAWDHFDWYTQLGGTCDIAMTLQMNSISKKYPLQFKAIDMKQSS
ncbi:MAG: single-stranded-DNA-specific exonuclease RecJ [SAR324 cluster bacterium]|nr:single-stranded-DNA-specific exonuclease RecJ [SAR324 cluster bacterium]